jgi:hypothetical protein
LLCAVSSTANRSCDGGGGLVDGTTGTDNALDGTSQQKDNENTSRPVYPIFQSQTFYPLKFTEIMGHQHRVFSKRMACNP